MLSLRDLARLAGTEEKTIFPYKILNNELKKNIKIDQGLFENKNEFEIFKNKYGLDIDTYKILEEYCKNDVLITKKSIIRYWTIIQEAGFINNNKILTAAKLSIENYFKTNNIVKKKINIKFDRILRKGYYGGRVEVFGNPNENEIMLHFDWSGMYAQCMSEKILGGEVFESNIIKSFNEPGFYFIKFYQNLEIPVLPIKKKKLFFANGIFEGWYWFEEIQLAVERGVEILEIKKIISAQYFDYFLKDFVQINNNIRDLGPLHKQIGKNNNNTFYGRMGMDPEKFEEEIINYEFEKNKYEKVIQVNGATIGYKKKEKSVSNILISAAITSKARIKLYKGILEIKKNGGRPLYTDTDSIIAAFDIKKYKSFLDSFFGEVFFDSKKEDTVIKDAVFAMPKTYAIRYLNGREVVKIKGFNVTPSFEDFKDAFYNKKEITTINNEWNKKDLMIKYAKREKTTNLNSLDKRIWSRDLKNTQPLNI